MTVQEREGELGREAKRQERNEDLRKTFAQHTNAFHGWLSDTRTALMDGRGSLEEQLDTVKVNEIKTAIVPFNPSMCHGVWHKRVCE